MSIVLKIIGIIAGIIFGITFFGMTGAALKGTQPAEQKGTISVCAVSAMVLFFCLVIR